MKLSQDSEDGKVSEDDLRSNSFESIGSRKIIEVSSDVPVQHLIEKKYTVLAI